MLKEMLCNVKTVAISGHIRPDGDCIGSCLGFCRYLKDEYPQIQTDVYLEEFRPVFRFLSGAKEVHHDLEGAPVYDLFIALDCGDRERLGFSVKLFDEARHTLCVDHHISNQAFAEKNYIVPDASSTSELVYRLTEGVGISKEAAEALYMGIVHDTGVFQYSCTAPETMETAAALMRTGIDAPRIIEETFFQKTYEQNRILGKMLFDSKLYMEERCIAVSLSIEEMKKFHVTAKDVDGVVSQLRNTKGVELAVFLYEVAPGEYKASLRSSDRIDVSRLAGKFGGGGHKKASGFNMKESPEEIIRLVIEAAQIQIADSQEETVPESGTAEEA